MNTLNSAKKQNKIQFVGFKNMTGDSRRTLNASVMRDEPINLPISNVVMSLNTQALSGDGTDFKFIKSVETNTRGDSMRNQNIFGNLISSKNNSKSHKNHNLSLAVKNLKHARRAGGASNVF